MNTMACASKGLALAFAFACGSCGDKRSGQPASGVTVPALATRSDVVVCAVDLPPLDGNGDAWFLGLNVVVHNRSKDRSIAVPVSWLESDAIVIERATDTASHSGNLETSEADLERAIRVPPDSTASFLITVTEDTSNADWYPPGVYRVRHRYADWDVTEIKRLEDGGFIDFVPEK